MAGSVADFISQFKTDVARPSRFDVQIPIPIVLVPYLGDARKLNFRCESAELPGRTLMTTERDIGTSPIQKFPYQTSYNDMTLTFIVSDDMSEKLFFDAWMELINPTTNYNFQYKSNYVSDISINQYDVAGDLTYSAVLIDAFPIAVNQMDLSWSSQDYHKISVVFAYTEWKNNSIEQLGKNIISAGLSGLINTLTGNSGV